MAALSYSPLAVRVTDGVRDPASATLRKVFGALLHTTGRGVVAQAKQQKRTPLDVALETYLDSQNDPDGDQGYKWGGPAYIIDHDGKRYQIAPDEARTHHAGNSKNNRAAYISGHWTAKCSNATVNAWKSRWPQYSHPYQLFPSKSPNWDYVGIEIVPCGYGFGQPMRPGLLFTKEQHDSAAELAADIAARHGFPAGWQRTSRLAGHEDVDILERMDSHGGWDPGFLRAAPYFDFAYVRARIV